MEIDGANDSQLLFTPAINQDIHALFLNQIAESDPDSLHVVIQDQAGFHLGRNDARLPANRLYDNLRQLEDHLIAIAREWTEPGKVHSPIHCWMRDQANAGAPT